MNTDKKQWLAIGIVGVLCVFAIAVSLLREPPDPLPETVTAADGKAYAMGRIDDPDAAETFRQQQPAMWFGDTPAGQVKRAAGDRTIILANSAKAVLGKFLPARDQGGVGSCVGFGTAAAIDTLMCVQILRGDRIEFIDIAPEIIYAGSRVEIGGGRIRGDGSVGSWAARFVNEYGVMPRKQFPGLDLRTYSETLCRELGKRGVPDDLEPEARKSPVKGITGVRNAEEAANALDQGYPIAVCSDQGFTTTRDKDGFLRASGTWNHCMACIGYTDVPRKGFLIRNSWGASWVNGPRGPHDIPDGCFWCDYSTFDRMCKQKDTWAFSDAVGFPVRDPLDDWFIQVRPAGRNVAAGPRVPLKEGGPCSLAY